MTIIRQQSTTREGGSNATLGKPKCHKVRQENITLDRILNKIWDKMPTDQNGSENPWYFVGCWLLMLMPCLQFACLILMFIQSRSAGFKHCYNDKQYIHLSGLTPREILQIKQNKTKYLLFNFRQNITILRKKPLVFVFPGRTKWPSLLSTEYYLNKKCIYFSLLPLQSSSSIQALFYCFYW